MSIYSDAVSGPEVAKTKFRPASAQSCTLGCEAKSSSVKTSSGSHARLHIKNHLQQSGFQCFCHENHFC